MERVWFPYISSLTEISSLIRKCMLPEDALTGGGSSQCPTQVPWCSPLLATKSPPLPAAATWHSPPGGFLWLTGAVLSS